MSIRKDLRLLLRPHYISNILLCASFVALRTIYPVCNILFPSHGCELNWREWEILTFLAIVVVFRTRRAGATTLVTYLSSACMYCKLANFILFMTADPRMGIVYGIICILHLLLLPEPSYAGPENVLYFRGTALNDELSANPNVIWFVTFYAAWSPSCVNFAPIFAELSANYSLNNLKFGKVDVTRFPEVAKEHHVSDSSLSRQLPTIIMFKGGKEYMRVPTVDNKGKFQKFFFTEDNVKAVFDLNNVYGDCKKKLASTQKRDELEKPKSE